MAMLKNKKPGVSIVETLIVIAISGALFVVVLGVFNTRKRAQVDDAARQVMSEIARVRNQAQQGQGPTNATEEGVLRGKLNQAGNPANLPGNEIFGQAIEFVPYSGSGEGKMIVHKLMQNPTSKAISDYGKYEITMPDQLQWNIFNSSFNQVVNPGTVICETSFMSCYKDDLTGTGPFRLKTDMVGNNLNLYLVFRAGTGESFMLNSSNYSNFDCYYNSSAPKAPPNCRYVKQPVILKLAFGIPGVSGSGADPAANAQNSINQYYAIFNLTVPNNQELKVAK